MIVHGQYCNLACMGHRSPWPYRSQHILVRHAALPDSLHSARVMRIHSTCRLLRKAHGRKVKQSRVSATDSERESRTAGGAAIVQEAEPYLTHCWTWRDHRINYAVAGCGPPVVFVHGFGASIGHFRKNIPALSQNYKVYAIDLLGFGRSDKPLMSYSIELWTEQLLDFLSEFVSQPSILVGNSIGSLISLMASAEGGPERVKGTVLLNCAGGMNTKGLTDDWRVRLAFPVFRAIDFLLSRQRIARYLFNNFRTKDNLKRVLQRVYINPEAVDDALVDLIHTPSEAEGALEAFVSVISGPPGPRPEAIFDRVSGPILLLWGQRDTVTPLDGPVAKFMKAAADSRPQTQFKILQANGPRLAGMLKGGLSDMGMSVMDIHYSVGHCLHDDNPQLVNGELLKWLQEYHACV